MMHMKVHSGGAHGPGRPSAEQGDEGVHGQARLPDDCAKSALRQLTVVGHGNPPVRWLLAPQNQMAPR